MSMTSVIRYMQALDTTATDGSGKTGLAFGDITAKYLRQGGTLTSLTTETITTLGTYQAPTDAAHIRIKELANTDPTKGIYEVHFHNTQVVDTGNKLWLFLSATGARFQPLELDLIRQTGDSYLFASRTVIRGTVGNATTPSTTQFTPSALSVAGIDADQLIGRVIIFDLNTTTTAMQGQGTPITANSVATLPLLTFRALTRAPANGDTFSIV